MILPVITGAGLQSAYRIAAHSNGHLTSAKPSISWSSFVAFILLIMYDTVIATLALTQMAPPNDLICPLERRWSQFFSSKNAAIVRTIQERHQCCGFRSVQDRAWPFPDRSHSAASCAHTFGRQQGCLGGWRQDQQITAGLMLLVAITVFMLKVSSTTSTDVLQTSSPYTLANRDTQLVMLVLYRTRNPFVSPAWNVHDNTASENGESGTAENEGRGSNARGQIEAAYSDEPDDVQLEDSHSEGRNEGQTNDQGAVLQPSRLHDNENEWRET